VAIPDRFSVLSNQLSREGPKGNETARFPRRRYSDRYVVTFNGKPLVDHSRDPEHDAARALKALGYTGKFHMIDVKTDKHRMTVDIEKAAELTVVELEEGGFSIRKWRPFPAAPEAPPMRYSDHPAIPSAFW
jgi:hypothetical protein